VVITPAPEPCVCDDGDPCTEDRCDPTTRACAFVPRDPANACLTDRHCDDGLACTEDACALDDCDLMRCRHDLVVGCERCDAPGPCRDDDPCSLETCDVDLCEHTPLEGCEPLCAASQRHRTGAVLGLAEPARPCEDCPCVTGLVLATDEGRLQIESLGSAVCEVRACGEPLRCRPLLAGQHYVVWGEREEERLTVEGYCLFTSEGLAPGHYDGHVAWHDGGVTTLRLRVWDDLSSASVLESRCDACPVTLPLQDLTIDLREDFGRRLALAVELPDGARAPAAALLVPGARGYHGLVRVDATRWGGDIELTLEPP